MLQREKGEERRKVMIRTKESNAKKAAIPSNQGIRTPTHALRGVWEDTGLEIGRYRLVLSCSLKTHKK